MRTALFAWELGDNLGHVAAFAPVVRRLRDEGVAVHVALQRIDAGALDVLGPVDGVIQAPRGRWIPADRPPVGFADLLRPFGWLDAAGLTGQLVAWRRILAAVRPDVLVADAAPGALLAARALPIRRILFSTGYALPPTTDPLPALRFWTAPSGELLAQREAEVLAAVRDAQRALGDPVVGSLADLWRGAERRLVHAAPATDAWRPVRPAGDVEHLGPLPPPDGGAAPRWPPGDGPRVFAYLSARFARLDELLRALHEHPARVIAVIPGLPEGVAERYPRVAFSRSPVRIEQARREADAAVCHSACGTGSAFLAAGVPVLLAPMHVEQGMAALGLVRSGAVRLLAEVPPAPLLAELLAPPTRAAARALALGAEWRVADPVGVVVDAVRGAAVARP